ncbi:MAG: hypothetical protein ICV66_08475 [Chitinophagaceae bacterium]|nr:hypothetical protein [Chitinophagaceae bacterium]
MQINILKASILAAIITVVSIAGWEIYLRIKGLNICYDDGNELWSYQRNRVYLPSTKSTVFIGASRIKYDLDIETWKKLTGNEPIQLAIEGNSPLPVLDDLADDENFKGRVVVDVTEGLFFTNAPNNIDVPKEHVKYYHDRTPAQRGSFHINHLLESAFVFLDRDNFSSNAFFERLPLQNRKGVFAIPNKWPLEFGRITFERQNIMMQRFLTDTNLQRKVTGNWLFFGSINTEKPAEGKKMDSILVAIKKAVDKIRLRGGDVLYVRTPSSGWYWQTELKSFPRDKYWDRLLAFTKCQGIHFDDYPELHFTCPEWSHLGHADAISFTKHFIQILKTEKNWTFFNEQKTSTL